MTVLQDQGPHIYQTCPSANYYDCKAMAIGARSQSARTYVEKHLDKFLECKYAFGLWVCRQMSVVVDIKVVNTILWLSYTYYLVLRVIASPRIF